MVPPQADLQNSEMKTPQHYLHLRGTETWKKSQTSTWKSSTWPNPTNQDKENANYASRRNYKCCSTTNREISSTDATKSAKYADTKPFQSRPPQWRDLT